MFVCFKNKSKFQKKNMGIKNSINFYLIFHKFIKYFICLHIKNNQMIKTKFN